MSLAPVNCSMITQNSKPPACHNLGHVPSYWHSWLSQPNYFWLSHPLPIAIFLSFCLFPLCCRHLSVAAGGKRLELRNWSIGNTWGWSENRSRSRNKNRSMSRKRSWEKSRNRKTNRSRRAAGKGAPRLPCLALGTHLLFRIWREARCQQILGSRLQKKLHSYFHNDSTGVVWIIRKTWWIQNNVKMVSGCPAMMSLSAVEPSWPTSSTNMRMIVLRNKVSKMLTMSLIKMMMVLLKI